jgi:hypothetical protein
LGGLLGGLLRGGGGGEEACRHEAEEQPHIRFPFALPWALRRAAPRILRLRLTSGKPQMTGAFIWRSASGGYARGMKRGAVVILSLLACSAAPAFAQDGSELAGAPGWRTEQEQAAKRGSARRHVEDEIAQARAATKLRADQAAAARRADAVKKTEAARLARQAEDLKAREAQLKAREEELAAEQERIARQLAEIEKNRTVAEAEAPREPPLEGPVDEPLEDPALDERPGVMRLDASIRSCEFAGEDKALARDYLSARYVRAPRFFERQGSFDDVWELRGVMQVEDRRGYLLADTVCELDRNGRVERFVFMRPGY